MATHGTNSNDNGDSSQQQQQQPPVADIEDFHVCHEESMNRAEGTYIDPATGFMVFTELTHMKRGKCCGNRCRHCPYGFEKVRPPGGHRSWRTRRANPDAPPPPPVKIPGAPVSKLRSGDIETAQRMVREIFQRAGKLDDSVNVGKIAITNRRKLNKTAPVGESDDDDLSSTSSSSSSSSSYSSSSSSSASTKESNDSSIRNKKPTTITVIEAVKDTVSSSASTTAVSFQSNSSAATTSSATTTSSNDQNSDRNRPIPTTATTTTPTKNVPYTRSGDQGTSQLGTGERRSKTDDAFEAMGTVDELCSFVGVAHSQLLNSRRAKPTSRNSKSTNRKTNFYGELPLRLLDVMSRLFDVGSHVAKPTPPSESGTKEGAQATVFISNGIGDGFDADHVDDLEEWINEMTEDLPELTSFILPTGAPASASLHVARTVCRRAERRLVPLVVDHKTCDPNAMRYLNRLSDFFFVAARWVNYKEGQEEIEYRLDIYDDDGDGGSDNASHGGNEDQRGRVVRSLGAPSE